MLIKQTRYRLSEIIVTEHGAVLYTWQMHTALGIQRSGRCFIIGNILALGRCDHEEPGFLKFEFHEQLRKLPPWNKTRYYCSLSDLLKVDSAQSLSGDILERLAIEKKYHKPDSITDPRAFRLSRYKITVDKDSLISWKTFGEPNRTVGGECFVESGILFLGPEKDAPDEGQSKQKFFADCKLLPRWDKTFAWAHHGSLVDCCESVPPKSYAAAWEPEHMKPYLAKALSFSKIQHREFGKDNIPALKASGFEWLKTAWYRIAAWKVWGRLMLFIIGGMILGFRFVMFIAEKISVLSRRVMERFRRYRKNRP